MTNPVKNPFYEKQREFNFKNAAVEASVLKAIGFTKEYFSTPKEMSTANIRKHLCTNHELGNFLFKTLLICTDTTYVVGEKSREYVLNPDGIDYLYNKIGLGKLSKKEKDNQTSELALYMADIHYEENLDKLESDTLEYNFIDYRIYNELQNMRSYIRPSVLANRNVCHSYDICCASPTILYQVAQHIDYKLKLETLELYIDDRTKYREEIASSLDIPISRSKELLSAMVFGAKIDRSLTKILKYDNSKVNILRNLDFYIKFKNDISVMWNVIGNSDKVTRKRNETTGKLLKLSGSEKAAFYRFNEYPIVLVIREYLKSIDNIKLSVHDGFYCRDKVDLRVLTKLIKTKTGFKVKFDYTYTKPIPLKTNLVLKMKSKNTR